MRAVRAGRNRGCRALPGGWQQVWRLREQLQCWRVLLLWPVRQWQQAAGGRAPWQRSLWCIFWMHRQQGVMQKVAARQPQAAQRECSHKMRGLDSLGEMMKPHSLPHPDTSQRNLALPHSRHQPPTR